MNWSRMFLVIFVVLALLVCFILFLTPAFMGDP